MYCFSRKQHNFYLQCETCKKQTKAVSLPHVTEINCCATILNRGIRNSGMGEHNTKEENLDVNAINIFYIIAFTKSLTDKLIITKE